MRCVASRPRSSAWYVSRPPLATAQTYPNRPIRLLHGFAAGGAADTMARIVSDGLSKRLGQPVIVEAKPGAGGNLAADAVAKSAPDGYTIGLVTGAHAISGALYKQLAYSPADSFDMLSTMVYYALVIAVRADHQAKTLADLIAMAKAKPDDAELRLGRFRQHASSRRRAVEHHRRHQDGARPLSR